MKVRINNRKKKKVEQKEYDLFSQINNIDYSKFYECEKSKILDKYWLDRPFSIALISENNGEVFYHVLEPKVSKDEFLIIEEIHSELRDSLSLRFLKNGIFPEEKEQIMFKEFIKIFKKLGYELRAEALGKIWFYIKTHFLGYERLDSILKDPFIEDVSCSGYNLPVYVFHRVYGSLPTNLFFTPEELDRLILKLSQKAGIQVSLENPLADGSISEKLRVQLTYKSVVSSRGSSFTIRKFSEEPITPLDLIAWNTASAELMAFLWLAVENKKNMIIIGGTASGKTTMLNAISLFIPFNSKIVSIEDTREISLSHENWLPLVTREVDGKARVEMFDLLKSALRQRPEYILVGEIRGREAITLFQAMNTGHVVYSTFHAGDVDSAVKRLIHDPINVPRAMFTPLDFMMSLRTEYIRGKAVRRVISLDEVFLDLEGRIGFNQIFKWDPSIDSIKWKGDSIKIVDIAKALNLDYSEVIEEVKKRAEFLKELAKRRPLSMKELIKEIGEYRKRFYESL